MTSQTPELNVGDKIGFVFYAQGIDEKDRTLFFPVTEITERDGERAYIYEFPDGSRSSAAITQSALVGHALEIQPRLDSRAICLSERKTEFVEALNRGKDDDLEVFADWDFDCFVVVNRTKNTEYRVKLQSHGGQPFGECECPDYKFRRKANRRICKHLAEVLTSALLTSKI